ncbi:MAG: hypothetical protein IJU07_01920, partial [Synergistaceae bacterium]|nr:hypothetical protein [Synergistaceae bacterium]
SQLEPLLEGIDRVILVGDVWREALKGDYDFVKTWQEALEILNGINEWQGLLIKGSNSIGLANIVKALTE